MLSNILKIVVGIAFFCVSMHYVIQLEYYFTDQHIAKCKEKSGKVVLDTKDRFKSCIIDP
jgi:hypothetical protein